jgi:hypothetical protein
VAIKKFVNKSATTRKSFSLYDPETGEREENWLDLRTEVSGGEQTQSEVGFLKGVNLNTGNADLNVAEIDVARLDLWIHDWSFTNEQGAHVKPTPGNIQNLPPDLLLIVSKKVDEHEEAFKKRRFALERPIETETGSSASETPTGNSEPSTQSDSGTSSTPPGLSDESDSAPA